MRTLSKEEKLELGFVSDVLQNHEPLTEPQEGRIWGGPRLRSTGSRGFCPLLTCVKMNRVD